jgi:hypothetical protein
VPRWQRRTASGGVARARARGSYGTAPGIARAGKQSEKKRTFVCAKGNKLANDLATTGQEPEPEGGYRHWELPEQYR